MEIQKKDKKVNNKKDQVNEKNRLPITYTGEELNRFYPHLMSEILKKTKTLKIDSIDNKFEKNSKDKSSNQNNNLPEELVNPSAIDFIRRCKNIEEALEILDYLFNKKEISEDDYLTYKKQLTKPEGLKELIEKAGGKKRPGFYLNKYYNKRINNGE